jgi:Reverse transcriptase (RNA-dependent DNA polymerase)
LSSSVKLAAGVRQGGILSLILFSFFVNDLLIILDKCKFRCFINPVCVNSFMYADDIIILAITVKDMQKIIDICIQFFDGIDLPINLDKCHFLRIGPTFKNVCAQICAGIVNFPWTNQVRYLGVYISSAIIFQCDYTEARHKFFRAFNAIYEKVGAINMSQVVISLVKSNCVPMLLYGTDAAGCSKYERGRVCNAFDRCS